ncbi:MAG: polysaccharide pyruvyl transferase family protein [Scytolyngbya sp. HA4215-MV1]|jgi:polysaccharide pyruvyl transferase WcaK-like protein|nr:polysaccharide pyruvyl transferase family protein [Scytolyngbya sp. HA4215-MV1]
MKIAIFGYYNALNAGDDRIQYCITRLLQGHQVIFLPHYLPPPKDYLQSFDWILIGGGGLVFEQVGIWNNTAKWIQDCKAKIGVLGLGVNHISQKLCSEVLTLIEKADFFYVRDHTSKALLNQHSKIEVYPDLTWCFPFQSEQQPDRICQGIALNLLPCHWRSFDIDAWVRVLTNAQIHPFPLHFGINRDFDLLHTYFGDRTPQEFSLKPLMNSQLLIACRFHAIVFAMQLGKPFIAINYDDKVRRLLAEADLLECCLQTTEHHQLLEKIQFVLEHQTQLQQKIAVFNQLQHARSQILLRLVQDHLLPQPSPTKQDPLSTLRKIAKITTKKLVGRV